MKNNYNNKNGFTLVELILTIALMVTSMAIAAPVFQSFLFQNQVELALDSSVRAVRYAQLLSTESTENSGWSVNFQPSVITVYLGNDFNLRDPVYDITFSVDSSIALSGLANISFTAISGTTTNTGNITVSKNSESKSFSINERGTITYL